MYEKPNLVIKKKKRKQEMVVIEVQTQVMVSTKEGVLYLELNGVIVLVL